MKKLNVAYPFESMQGKLGTKQDLRYAENDNKAFYSPEGKVNYARNYKPVMVAARVARTGLNYFAIKTKAAFKNTAASRLLCALMGATSAIYGWVIKQISLMSQLYAQYGFAVKEGFNGTFRKWIINGLRDALASMAETLTIVGPTATITIGTNPFSIATTAIEISRSILVKFWKELTPNGISFTVDGKIGIAVVDMDFSTLASRSRINVLGLYVGEDDLIMIGSRYVLDPDGEYVTDGFTCEDDYTYTTTDVAPKP